MSVSGAMTTAVSGLVANSTAVARISENIANAGTVGYKRTFAEMVTQSVPGAGSVSGVAARVGSAISANGIMNNTGNAQDLAISGEGFFVVSKNPNDPLQSNYFLTRAGAFREDENGYLVNAAGYYLAGYQLDETGQVGAVDRNGFSGLTTLRIGDLQMPAEPTSTASVKGNLPAQETGLTTPGAPFLSSMEFFTHLGRSERLTLSWQPTTDLNTWDVTFSDSTGSTHGALRVAFNNSGTTPGAPLSYTMAPVQPTPSSGNLTVTADGVASFRVMVNGDAMEVDLNLGAPGTYDGMQQLVGDFTPQKFTTNGSAQTALARSETDEQGIVWGVFEDGRRRALYEIPLAQVTNPDGLSLIDGNAYTVTRAAGDLVMNKAGSGSAGTVISGALEASTVEVATELTDLIRVQRMYSTNAKIISAADEMLQEINNLKR